MSEIEIIGLTVAGLSAIFGLGGIVVRPLLKAVKAITELTACVKELTKKFEAFELNNHDAHKRLWEKNEAQDEQITDHDRRLSLLEHFKDDGK